MNEVRKKHEAYDKVHQSKAIKQHYKEHPEHRKAISLAQKNKWVRYKKALEYCIQANINLELV